jgi:hypothetical protein
MEATGSPAHLRSLLRRLRRRMPAAPLFLALWSADLPPDPERDLRSIEGADDQASLLRDVVVLCVEYAEKDAGGSGGAGTAPPTLLTSASPSAIADATAP